MSSIFIICLMGPTAVATDRSHYSPCFLKPCHKIACYKVPLYISKVITVLLHSHILSVLFITLCYPLRELWVRLRTAPDLQNYKFVWTHLAGLVIQLAESGLHNYQTSKDNLR